jgi:D-alanyl-D-alanine dipeptidase
MRYLICALAALGISSAPAPAGDRSEAQQSRSKVLRGFVAVRDLAPGIVEDMRYATTRNFTGRRVAGYHGNRCILARPVARALARVHRAVARKGYAIKVYDCYRPARAVDAFVRWASGRSGGDATKYYYPRIARHRIIPLGYISKRSSHSLGTAIDLTLVRRPEKRRASAQLPGAARPEVGTKGSCIAPKARRLPDTSLDMGTSWDCFDVRSHTRHGTITGAPKANRSILLRAMQAEGFRNYRREWWHFSMPLRAYFRTRNFIVD